MRVLVTGASGQLGAYLMRSLFLRDEAAIGWTAGTTGELFGTNLQPIDLADRDAVRDAFEDARPELVIHAGAVAKPGEAAKAPDRARAVNVEGTRHLAELAGASGCRFLMLSTDMVFDGESGAYTEEDPPTPVSTYGRTKVEAESIALDVPGAAVLRLSLLVGPTLNDRPTLFDKQMTAIWRGEPVRLFDDEWRTPLDLPTAAEAVMSTALSEVEGLFHLGGPQCLSRYDMGRIIAEAMGRDTTNLVAASRLSIESAEPRPRDTSLDSTAWAGRFPEVARPSFEAAVCRMVLAADVLDEDD